MNFNFYGLTKIDLINVILGEHKADLPAGGILKLNFLGVKCDETRTFIDAINGGRSRPLRRYQSETLVNQ